MTDPLSSGTDRPLTTDPVAGAKTKRGQSRPEYVRNPDRSRDPPTGDELEALKLSTNPLDHRRQAGAKLWRKAREGKL